MKQSSVRLVLTCFLLFAGLLLEVFSLRSEDVTSIDPSAIYTDAVHRERLHGAAVVLILCALTSSIIIS